jgi:hypothetical protein
LAAATATAGSTGSTRPESLAVETLEAGAAGGANHATSSAVPSVIQYVDALASARLETRTTIIADEASFVAP